MTGFTLSSPMEPSYTLCSGSYMQATYLFIGFSDYEMSICQCFVSYLKNCMRYCRPRAGKVHGCSASSGVWKPRGDPDVGDLEHCAFPQALRAPGAQAVPPRASRDARRHCWTAAAFERRCHWKEVSALPSRLSAEHQRYLK